jgi:very-short-patch-repair endonuclease
MLQDEEKEKEEVVIPPPRFMKPLRWQKDRESSTYMRKRTAENRARSKSNACENWMAEKLKGSGFKFSRQVSWGFRVFDFWCAALGIAVEVDGPEHDAKYDAHRDEYNYRRSGIVVLRVRNWIEEDAAAALTKIAKAVTWKERRDALGLNSKGGRRRLVAGPEPPLEPDAHPRVGVGNAMVREA